MRSLRHFDLNLLLVFEVLMRERHVTRAAEKLHLSQPALSHALKRHSPAARQYLLAVPPMHRFTALPSPLRQLLGWRARQLDEKQKQLAGQPPGYLQHIHYPELEPPSLLAEDGYHPGPRGYRAMAKAVAAQLWD